MFQPRPSEAHYDPEVLINGVKLASVTNFCYHGSVMSCNSSLTTKSHITYLERV